MLTLKATDDRNIWIRREPTVINPVPRGPPFTQSKSGKVDSARAYFGRLYILKISKCDQAS